MLVPLYIPAAVNELSSCCSISSSVFGVFCFLEFSHSDNYILVSPFNRNKILNSLLLYFRPYLCIYLFSSVAIV